MNQLYLSIIIPAYNEAKIIKKNLQIIDGFLKTQSFNYEIIIANDGSTDNTVAEIHHSAISVVLLDFHHNTGKGFVVQQAMLKAQGKFVVFLDADLATPITELNKIIQPLEQNIADVVIGSRAISKKDVDRSWLRAFLGLGFRQLKTVILGITIFDSQCGFKGFKQETIQPIFSKQTTTGWSFDAEILLIANKLSYKILEVPINWSEQGDSKMKLHKEVFKMLWELIKIRYKHRH